MHLLLAAIVASAISGRVPRRAVVVTDVHVEVYQPITFARGSAQLPADAERTLAVMADTLNGNPSLVRVAVEARVTPADGRTAGERDALGRRRAEEIRDRLVAHGVAASRLVVATAAGHDADIAFVVLQRL